MPESHDRLKEARQKAGYDSAKAAAEALGVALATYTQHENGNRGFKSHAERYARFFRTTPEWLLYGRTKPTSIPTVPLGPSLPVKGTVAAGRWREAFESPRDEWVYYTGRADVTADLEHRFGLLVDGDSMSEIYPEGTIVDCVNLFGRAEALPGKKVVVIRQRESDLCYEATVKELVEIDGVMWARPRSHNPAHQAFRLDQPEPGILEVRIIAVVVGSYRPE